jgi:UrcA family protein
MSLRARIVLGSIAAFSMSFASTLYAADGSADSIQRQSTVHFADLNLDRSADVAVLYERISQAAEQVCRQRALNGADVVSPRFDQCVADTVEKAVAKVNRASLTAFSRERQPMRVASAAAPF